MSDFSFKKWLGEGVNGVRSTLAGHSRILPQSFHEHMKASRKELLLAVRSLFDAAIEGGETTGKTLLKKETNIKVE